MKEPKLHIVRLDKNVLLSGRYSDDKAKVFYRNIDTNINNFIFKGYLVNISSTSLYFEPEDHNGLIIVPHAWIKWCVPIDEKNDAFKKMLITTLETYNEKYICLDTEYIGVKNRDDIINWAKERGYQAEEINCGTYIKVWK